LSNVTSGKVIDIFQANKGACVIINKETETKDEE
jgi:hypothetical protein